MGDLDDIRVKIARAGEHLHELGRRLDDFAKSKPYSIVVETDPQTGDQLFKIDREPERPPDLPVIGDVLYNLRSALDHLAWQLVIKAGGSPNSRTAFPIFNDSAKFHGPRAQAKMAGMNSAMQVAIQNHQPCFGRNANRNQALWSLEEYGNIDKHRRPLLVPISTQDMLWSPGGHPVHIHKGPVYKDTILVRFPPTQQQSQLNAMPSVAFDEPPAAGEDVKHFLSLVEYVVASLVDEFEAAFF
jgi:hypothetical protein